jgi:hypothetical protein
MRPFGWALWSPESPATASPGDAGYALGSRSSLSLITLADAGNYLLQVKAIVDSFVEFRGLDGMGPTAFAAGH